MNLPEHELDQMRHEADLRDQARDLTQEAAEEVEAIRADNALLENKLIETQCELEKALEQVERMRGEHQAMVTEFTTTCQQHQNLQAVANGLSDFAWHHPFCKNALRKEEKCDCGLEQVLARYSKLVEGQK